MTLAGYENEPPRSLTTGKVTNGGLQLLHSEVRHRAPAQATLPSGCSPSRTEHGRHTKAGLFPGGEEFLRQATFTEELPEALVDFP